MLHHNLQNRMGKKKKRRAKVFNTNIYVQEIYIKKDIETFYSAPFVSSWLEVSLFPINYNFICNTI